MIEVLNCVDSSGQKWYEVDYLAQNKVLKETHYTNNSNQSQGSRYHKANTNITVTL